MVKRRQKTGKNRISGQVLELRKADQVPANARQVLEFGIWNKLPNTKKSS